jgi:uncharacterized protein (DUF2252 family)
MPKKITATTPANRQAVLEERRNLKMARSAHAYVRGNTLQFYQWLEQHSGKKLPQGPPVWICGDCHVGNLGPVANADGKVEIEIRDLDQTVIGNPAHDLIRLSLSLATAARGSDLPGVTTALMMEEMIRGYQHALITQRTRRSLKDTPELKPIQTIVRQSMNREWRHLAQERIDDVKPTIPLGDRFWALSKEEKEEITKLFDTEDARKLITSLKHRDNDAKVRVLDAAYWMKGCSSLGRLRYAVLLGVGSKKDKEYCLVDIKEAIRAAAPAVKSSDMPKDPAQRVVTGACNLSPFLGERMLAAKFLSRSVVLRELMPQDLKLEMDTLTRDEAVRAASYLAGIIGKAHARQMNVATRKRWSAELNRNQPKNLNAPNWLWNSVVELIASHETAYLEHCRRYATTA